MILGSLTTLRSQPQGSKLWLSIYQPRTLLAGQINNVAIAKGSMEIAIDNISTGSIANIYSGSAMLIGSQPGWDDIGRIRVRYTNSPSGTVGIAENAMDLRDNQYVTAINQVDVAAIYPRIISDPSDAENVIFYKDYDIPYTNQNTILGSLICMGDHYAGFLESGSHNVYYTATGTVNVNGSANTFLWAFEGGTPSTSTALTPGNVAYTTPGHYATKLTVTSAQGSVDVSYRYVSIYNNPNEGTFNPILNWSMDSPSGSRSENGYTFSVQIRQQIDQIQPNAIVVIFADEFYGSTNTSIGGKPNREKIKFVGYILEDSIEYDYKTSTATFKVASVSELMKQADGFSVSCETKASPATWFEIYDLSVQKAIYHYLKWHSTVNLVADVQYTGSDLKHQYFDADRTSLFDAIYSFVKDGLKGNVVSDRGGKLWIEVEPEGLENPLSLPSSMDLLKQDWVGSPQIVERRSAQTSFIELNGIAFSGVSTGTFSALLSNAPSEVPLYRGKPKTEKGLILLGQSQLNTLSGNYLAMDNSRFPNIDFSLNGNYSNLDIAPIEIIKPFIVPEDTVRNVRIQNEKYLLERMDWSYDPVLGSFRPDISIRHITTGSAGVTIPIPDVPDDSGFSVPDIQVPPLPALFFPTQMSTISSGSVAAIAQNAINENADYGIYAKGAGAGIVSQTRGISLSSAGADSSTRFVIIFQTSRAGLYYCHGIGTSDNNEQDPSTDTINARIGLDDDGGGASDPFWEVDNVGGAVGGTSNGVSIGRLFYSTGARIVTFTLTFTSEAMTSVSFDIFRISG